MSATLAYFLLFVQFLLLLASIALTIFMGYTIYAMSKGAPFVPTSRKNTKIMLNLANLRDGDVLMDLGSGDGRILFAAATRVDNLEVRGVEINPVLYWYSKIKNKLKGCKNIKIIRKNLWKVDLSDCDVLTIFFIGNRMKKLKDKIKKEMTPGSRVISHSFKFSNWKIERQKGENYLYIV